MECIRTCVFYVITASNFLIRKRCDHKDVFDCGCNFIDFDFVLVDYDYVHEEGTDIQDPRHTGTWQYRALPLLVCTQHILYTYMCKPTINRKRRKFKAWRIRLFYQALFIQSLILPSIC